VHYQINYERKKFYSTGLKRNSQDSFLFQLKCLLERPSVFRGQV
jgi:hypothetical protein